MKNAIIAIIILLMLVVSGFYIFKGDNDVIYYQTEPVIRGEIAEYITASGTIIPLKTTIIGSQVSGPIKEVYVDYNTKVINGQLLAIIDPALFEAKVAEAKASVLAAQAGYDKLIAILKNNERIMNRNKELYETDLIARIEFENAETEYLSTKAELESAKAKIEQAKAVLNNALTNLKYTRIISPTSGIVISKDIEVGQTVAASFQTPTLFTIAEDLTKMQIETNVSEADISKVKVGQVVEFTVDSYPGDMFSGKVVQIRNSPETIQNVVTYFVIIDVNNDDLKLMPGMTADVTIVTTKKENILLVPGASLKFIPESNDKTVRYNRQGVWILKDDKPVRIEIETGLSDDNYTEIISDNLKEGQKVIIATGDKSEISRRNFRRTRMF
jgi:HlyD family secretion protein